MNVEEFSVLSHKIFHIPVSHNVSATVLGMWKNVWMNSGITITQECVMWKNEMLYFHNVSKMLFFTYFKYGRTYEYWRIFVECGKIKIIFHLPFSHNVSATLVNTLVEYVRMYECGKVNKFFPIFSSVTASLYYTLVRYERKYVDLEN